MPLLKKIKVLNCRQSRLPNEWLEVKRSCPSPQAEVFSSPEGKKGEKGYRLQGQMNIFSTALLMNLLKPLTSTCEPCSVSRKDFVGLEFKADSLIFFGTAIPAEGFYPIVRIGQTLVKKYFWRFSFAMTLS
ncbi:MAG: hypothetical protein Q8N73_03035 [bacterium]|nr:hypothetical protein [bacterium]